MYFCVMAFRIFYVPRHPHILPLAAVGLAIFLSPPATPSYAQVFRSYLQGSVQIPDKTGKKRQKIRGYYPSGNLRFVASFKRGELDGNVLEYYETGVLKAEVEYEDNECNGTARYYYPNGILMAKIRYHNGHEIGMSKIYNKQGILTGKVSFRRKVRKQIDDSTITDQLHDTLLRD